MEHIKHLVFMDIYLTPWPPLLQERGKIVTGGHPQAPGGGFAPCTPNYCLNNLTRH
ncbi:hypothetical protein ACFLX5_02135 [Chloroflexota bacterium]